MGIFSTPARIQPSRLSRGRSMSFSSSFAFLDLGERRHRWQGPLDVAECRPLLFRSYRASLGLFPEDLCVSSGVLGSLSFQLPPSPSPFRSCPGASLGFSSRDSPRVLCVGGGDTRATPGPPFPGSEIFFTAARSLPPFPHVPKVLPFLGWL